MRVTAFIDGFNLFHALDDSGADYLKWVNLWALCEKFVSPNRDTLTDVLYFSAYATWKRDRYARHREYVAALTSAGVTPIMGRFKEKDRSCRKCGDRWKYHEEKETDVSIGVELVHRAHLKKFDLALLVSGDSDLVPAVRRVLATGPVVRVVAPLGRHFSMDIVKEAGGLSVARKMKRKHVEAALFGATVADTSGTIVASRPAKYIPPVGHPFR